MPFEFNRYSGLLLIFFVHGLVYAGLLLRKGIRNERPSDLWLSFFLFLCILYICPWMLGFAGWYDGTLSMECRNFMFYMPLQHTLLMGPVIYFYLRCLFQPGFRLSRRHYWHFIPALLYLVWCAIVFITDRLVLKRYYLMDGRVDPDFDDWYIAAGLVSLLVYGIISWRYYSRYKRFIVQEFSFADAVTFRWVRNFLIAFFIYFLSNLIFHLVQLAGIEINYTGSWWYYLLFALLFYYIAINGYSNSIETRMGFQLDLLAYKRTPLLSAGSSSLPPEDELIAYEEVPASATELPELQLWKPKVEQLMTGEKLYRNPELTLTDLAKRLGTNPVVLSKVINKGFGKNFNDFINSYRVAEVRERLAGPDSSQYTIMSLAYEAGFNSKATFNRAFKKLTGKNPSDLIS